MSDSSEDERPAREEEVCLNSKTENLKEIQKSKQKISDISLKQKIRNFK